MMLCARTAASRITTSTSKAAITTILSSSSSNYQPQQQQHLSTATTTNQQNVEDVVASPPTATNMFSWGTMTKGSIPVPEALEEGRAAGGTDAAGSGGAGSLLNRGGTVVDHPQPIDLNDAFGIDNKSITIQDIQCGPTSTAILFSNNTCATFGPNDNGQLGHGHTNPILTPTLLHPPDESPLHHDQIASIALGANFSAIIDTHGDLYTCGHNGSQMKDGIGCLGHGYFPEEYLHTPTLVQSLVEDNVYAKQVAVGNIHMTVLTTEGEVLTCGAGAYGRCGNLDPIDQLFLEPVEMLVAEKDIVQIAGGKDYTMALTGGDGIVFAWGKNAKGQCGTGSGLAVDMYAMEPMPMPVEGQLEGRKVVKIAAGESHAVALTDKGELFTWGMGQTFQPELITALLHTRVLDVSCGQDYTLAVGEDGNTYSFGKGKTGVLGLASEKSANQPRVIEGLAGNEVVKVSAGWTHAAVLCNPVEES